MRATSGQLAAAQDADGCVPEKKSGPSRITRERAEGDRARHAAESAQGRLFPCQISK